MGGRDGRGGRLKFGWEFEKNVVTDMNGRRRDSLGLKVAERN